MAQNRARPISPHLSIWKWGAHMATSIFHRATGDGMAIVGAMVLVWWLAAAASGKEAYDYFLSWAVHPLGKLVLVGLTWAFFQHLASGLRHLVLDLAAGYESNTNRFSARGTFVYGVVMTAAVWGYLLVVKG
ncbi:MAG: succinate dehydrogenase, cytochrome b556 subunit [Chakrabartia sp.]